MALPGSRVAVTRVDDAIVRALARLRSQPVTALMHGLEHLRSLNMVRVVGWATIALLLVSRRVRHLLTYLAVVLTVVLASGWLTLQQGRMRPAGARRSSGSR